VAERPKTGDRIIFPEGLPATIRSVEGEKVTYYGNKGTFVVPLGMLIHAVDIGPEWWRVHPSRQREDESA
jgi:hypothetical protein